MWKCLLDFHSSEAICDGGVFLHLGLFRPESIAGKRVRIHHRRCRNHFFLSLSLLSSTEQLNEGRKDKANGNNFSPKASKPFRVGFYFSAGVNERSCISARHFLFNWGEIKSSNKKKGRVNVK